MRSIYFFKREIELARRGEIEGEKRNERGETEENSEEKENKRKCKRGYSEFRN